MLKLNELSYPILVTGSLIAVSLAIFILQRTKKTFQCVGKVKELIFYPVKACQGIQVEQVEVALTGVKYGKFHDRQWCVVNDKLRMINLTCAPRLALIKPSLSEDELILKSNESDEKIHVPFREHLTIEDNIFTIELSIIKLISWKD